jgi:hypothetical protein
LLVYINPDVIKETKKAALDLDTNASGIVEEALKEWLDRKAQGKTQKALAACAAVPCRAAAA